MQLLLPLQKSKRGFPKEMNLCCELGCSNLSQIEVINKKIISELIQVLVMRAF